MNHSFNRTTQRQRIVSVVGAMLAMAVATSSATAATIVYDNFDPTPTPFVYANFGSWTGNFMPTWYQTTATTFVPTASGSLDELTLGITNQKLIGSASNTLTLYNDNAGLPGTQLWQGTITVGSTFGSTAQLTGIGGPTLTAGQMYWLEAAPPTDGVTLHGWYSNNQSDMGSIISSGTPFPNALRYALRVGVAAVPEPAGLALGAVALGAMVMGKRRGGA